MGAHGDIGAGKLAQTLAQPPALSPVPKVPPLIWSGAWVRRRLREAYEVERRLPGGRRQNGGNGWPAIVHTFTDLVGWTDARDRVWREWARARGAYAFEISRMDEALGWLVILANHPGERNCLTAWCRTDGSLTALMRRRGWSRPTFYRRVNDGSNRIARALNVKGVKIR